MEEYDEPINDGEFNEQLLGEKHYYSFIKNVLLPKISVDSNGNKYVETMKIWEIDDENFNGIDSFIEDIQRIINILKIK
ncbi:MAG: hypothetical protein KF763_19130 [Cyclobacteriaceae bacterium]|nr:hypothetical protein [Cyclobacteriaceae bacterium]